MRTLLTIAGKALFMLKSRNIPKNPGKILVIRSGGIGDVLMSTPFLHEIRKHYRKAKISYLTGKWSEPALKNNHDIDEIITFDDEIVFKRDYSKILNLAKKLRKERFEIAFILDKAYQWNIFAFMAKIPCRIGFDRDGEGFSNTVNVPFKGEKHESEYYLDLARAIGIKPKTDSMILPLSKADKKAADSIFRKYQLKNPVGIVPGAASNPGQTAAIKRWPENKYVELINKLTEKNDIILFGGKTDRQINESIIKKAKMKNKIINLAGNITLSESAAVMDRCKAVVTHDSGPMHIAATTKTKLIALFGPTPAKRFAPKNSKVIEACRPCYDIYGNFNGCNEDCMNKITVEQVFKLINS